VRVLQGRDLYRVMAGLIRGLANQPRLPDVDGSMVCTAEAM
jgi:hypothetical protein